MYTCWILSEEGHWKINFDAVCFQDVSKMYLIHFLQKKKKEKKIANLEFGYIFFRTRI